MHANDVDKSQNEKKLTLFSGIGDLGNETLEQNLETDAAHFE